MSNELTLDQYQELTNLTAIYPGQGGLLGLNYAAMEASGEAGEIANKVKKVSRDSHRDLLQYMADTNVADLSHVSGFFLDGLDTIFGTKQAGEYLNDDQRQAIAKEVGGALYGLARVASELGLSLGDIAQQNADILRSRMDRGTLQGSGDDR